MRISRGAGYAQYGGMPLVVEHDFHISRTTYEARKAFPWPESLPGTFVPAESLTTNEPEFPLSVTVQLSKPVRMIAIITE